MCPGASALRSTTASIAMIAVFVGVWSTADACKLILFRHVEKSGGTAVREYMHAYHPYWECIGQFCPAADHAAYKKRETEFSWMSVVDRFQRIANLRRDNKNAENDVRLFAEIHNRGIHPHDFRKMIEALRKAEETGCQVMALTFLRSPASHGISDFVYFHSDYVKQSGDPNITFEGFIRQWPENLLRRLSATKFFGIDVRGDGYIDDGARQLELYQEAKAYLRSFDVVSTTEQFSSTWNYICHFADLNSIEVDFENEPNKAKSILKKAQGKCEALATTGRVLAHDSQKEEDHIREHSELVKLYNPVSQRLWEEAFLAQDNLLYYFNKTLTPN